MYHTSNPLSVRGIILTCYTNSCCLLKEMSDIFRNKNSGSIYLTHKTTTQCRGLLPHSRKWNFALWSMPMPLSSPHSGVTKWRSASQESKSILNYVMLFLWAIMYGSYLSQQRCRRHRGLFFFFFYFCQRLKNKFEIGAEGLFLLWPVAS